MENVNHFLKTALVAFSVFGPVCFNLFCQTSTGRFGSFMVLISRLLKACCVNHYIFPVSVRRWPDVSACPLLRHSCALYNCTALHLCAQSLSLVTSFQPHARTQHTRIFFLLRSLLENDGNNGCPAVQKLKCRKL